MDSEFIALKSRLTIRNGMLTEKPVKRDPDEGLTRYLAFVALAGFLIYSIDRVVSDKRYLAIAQIILIISWLIPHFRRIYINLFVKTWKSRIALDRIKDITTRPLENGLETAVTIHLKNGRKKFLVFRNAEHQAEPFIQALNMEGNAALQFN